MRVRSVITNIVWIISRAFMHQEDIRLIARSREYSKPRDSSLNFLNRSEIWEAPQQQCYGTTCPIPERYDNYNIQSHGFETTRDLAVRRPTSQWTEALIQSHLQLQRSYITVDFAFTWRKYTTCFLNDHIHKSSKHSSLVIHPACQYGRYFLRQSSHCKD